MLRGLRKASSNWLGKVVMAAVVGFLIISFGIWGIGDIFRGFGISTVAKVGRTEISMEQFRARYNEQLMAGYSKNTAAHGLITHMPDLDDLTRALAGETISVLVP